MEHEVKLLSSPPFTLLSIPLPFAFFPHHNIREPSPCNSDKCDSISMTLFFGECVI